MDDNICRNLHEGNGQNDAEQNALAYFLEVITGGNPDERHKLVPLVRDWQSHSAYYLLLCPGNYSISSAECSCLDREKFPSNVVSVLSVLKILVHFFEKSFFSCIQRVLTVAPDGNELESLLYGLWLLGYAGIDSWNSEELSYQKIFVCCLSKKYFALSEFLAGKGIPATMAKEQFCLAPLICFVRSLLSDNCFQSLFENVITAGAREILRKQLDFFNCNGYIPLNINHQP